MRAIWTLMGTMALMGCAQTPQEDARPAIYAACETTQPTGSRLKTQVCWTAEEKAIAENDVRTAKDQLSRSRPAPIPKDAQVGSPPRR